MKLSIELELLAFAAENSTKDSKLLFYSNWEGPLNDKVGLDLLGIQAFSDVQKDSIADKSFLLSKAPVGWFFATL